MGAFAGAGFAAEGGFGGFGFLGGGYVVQKFRPQVGHFQNCCGGQGWPGAGSRRSICSPQRWHRIRMSTPGASLMRLF